MPLDSFHYITRIHYKSTEGSADGIWGEHESKSLNSRAVYIDIYCLLTVFEKHKIILDLLFVVVLCWTFFLTSHLCSIHPTVDYILFVRADPKVKARENEVCDWRFVSQDELRELMATAGQKGLRITPWFKLIVENFIYKWWDAFLHGSLHEHVDHNTIHKLIAPWLEWLYHIYIYGIDGQTSRAVPKGFANA